MTVTGTKDFPVSLGISILSHLSIIFFLSAFNILPKPRPIKPTEITYLKLRHKSQATEIKKTKNTPVDILDNISPRQPLILGSADKITRGSIPAPKTEDYSQTAKINNSFHKPPATKTEISPPNTIKLSAIEMESAVKLAQNPVYLTYSNFLRESIRRCLYHKFSQINDKGIVCLKFALNQDGSLFEYHIIDAKSTAGESLRKMSIEGLKDAAPFPPLPKELAAPVATFSVIIHFIEQQIE